MSIIYLARHGQTEWNHGVSRYCGATDVELNETGKAQAQHLAERLKETRLQAIYSSPLKRALLTAQIVGDRLNLPVTVDEGFREIHYGVWEGLTHARILSGYADIRAQWEGDPATVKPPGGETGIEVAERALASLRRILEEEKHERFLIVSHKTVHRLILCACLGVDLTDYRRRFSLGNAALSALEHDQSSFLLGLHNDKCHLAELSANRRKVGEGV
ncbi:MAG: histidine phosphatase family protein [Candidatus Eisenbacteria sp.]|nr:histidine phosphatase family protein [Candidatus Eisenbacteria bacterium]